MPIRTLKDDHIFPELPFIRILHDNTSVFRLQSRNDVFYFPMSRNPYLSYLNVPIDSPPPFITASQKNIYTHVLSRPYPSDSFVFLLKTIHTLVGCRRLLFSLIFSVSQFSLLLASVFVMTSLNTF
ncbi:unnamed protein product [Hymenolepis diminuta]|uniref:Uncharacterized protein n=1 Tax=Hymenolepis diminuta TaxID=6216 RepID=A0A564YZ79_HYMDI|nr:unnamed protein product [Hymenolepis diminuta]